MFSVKHLENFFSVLPVILLKNHKKNLDIDMNSIKRMYLGPKWSLGF